MSSKQLSIYTSLTADFGGFNLVYAEIVPQPYPVRTTVGSRLLGILVEIDVVAALRSETND